VTLLIVIAFCSLSCCGVLNGTEILVELPEPPAHWPAKLTAGKYIVKYLESKGSIREIEIDPGNRSVLLRLPSLPVVPVIALPQFGSPPAELKACGAIYPGQLKEGDRLALTWAGGFLAQMLLECAMSGDSMQAVNTPKLQQEILDRSEGNPWHLDPRVLTTGIVDETLAYRSLRLLPRHDIVVEALPGRWISGNPLSFSLINCPSGEAIFTDLAEGIHSFFFIDGNDRIDVSVSSTGWTAVNPVTGAGSTGNW
jgi:hypothetical protein